MLMNEYGSKYHVPSPEIARKLQLSREEAEKVKTREMRCPFCGFLVRIIPENQTDVVFVYCRKCKFEGPLLPAYFRRMKRYRQYALEFQKRRMNR